jgi:ribosomal protein S18 acetylase RimI-like enzyme
MPIGIAPMLPDDYREVRALWESSDGVGLDESDAEAGIVAFLERNPGLSCVARDTERADGQEIVAAVLCSQDGRRGCLSRLAVAPAYRQRGLGRQLVDRCCAQLAAAGIRRCTIHVFADNRDGIAFWERLGFAPRQEISIFQRATDR